MATRPETWPGEVRPLARQIREANEDLEQMLDICLNVGIKRKNYLFIHRLLPDIKDRYQQILEAAKFINKFKRNRRGRHPNWRRASEEIAALALDILTVPERGERRVSLSALAQEVSKQNYIVAGFLLRRIRDNNLAIKEQLRGIPEPDISQVPDLWLEALENVKL